MKDSFQKEPVSQSIFGSAPSAEMELQRRQRKAMQRRRQRIVLFCAIPLLLLIAAGVIAYKFHERAAEAHAHAEYEQAKQAPPPTYKEGWEQAQMKLEVTVPDESIMESPLCTVLHNAVAAKPSEIFINYKFIPPREDQKQSYEYGLTINGRDEIALKNSAGTEKKVKLDLSVKPEELAAVLNQSHAEIYGKVRVPLAVEAPARPQHHHDDEPGQKSPLDSLTLPEDSANRRD